MIPAIVDTVAVVGVLLFVGVLAPLAFFAPAYFRAFSVTCPQRGISTSVRLHPLAAGLRAAYGSHDFTVAQCPLWRPGEKCDSACVKRRAA